LDKGGKDAWDGVGVYTPNILAHKGKYYLAYTAMKVPFHRYNSQASIGLAVADSPHGPWKKLHNNPVITPSKAIDAPDGFLCDDTVFIVRNGKIWLYYKGFPRIEKDGVPTRAPGNVTVILAATADKPEGPYTKISKGLHLGHEAALWKEEDAIGSLCTNYGPSRYYRSKDGINFECMNLLIPAKAVGLYRADFEEGSKGARASWGIAMDMENGHNERGRGLCRFEFVWPD